MRWAMDILRGIVIGVANIIPGVSGGTMMVSMGIYDTLIHSITHLFKQFKQSIKTLLPYLIGMVIGIVGLAFVVTYCLENYPLPTNAAFIGLIFGGLPIIIKKVNFKKAGIGGGALFVLFFLLIVAMEVWGHGDAAQAQMTLNFSQLIVLFVMGCIASATMVIPGVSGSMVLMLLGYYQPVVGAVKDLAKALTAFDMSQLLHNLLILVPFGLGVVVGIFAIAKLLEMLLARFEGLTYCAILGLVVASPVAILMATDMSGVTVWTVVISVITCALGFYGAYRLTRLEKQ